MLDGDEPTEEQCYLWWLHVHNACCRISYLRVGWKKKKKTKLNIILIYRNMIIIHLYRMHMILNTEGLKMGIFPQQESTRGIQSHNPRCTWRGLVTESLIVKRQREN